MQQHDLFLRREPQPRAPEAPAKPRNQLIVLSPPQVPSKPAERVICAWDPTLRKWITGGFGRAFRSFNPNAELFAFATLRPEEVGAYVTILQHLHCRPAPLRDDDQMIAHLLRARPKAWQRAKTGLIRDGKIRIVELPPPRQAAGESQQVEEQSAAAALFPADYSA